MSLRGSLDYLYFISVIWHWLSFSVAAKPAKLEERTDHDGFFASSLFVQIVLGRNIMLVLLI